MTCHHTHVKLERMSLENSSERPDVPEGLILLKTSERLILRVPPRPQGQALIERSYKLRWGLLVFLGLVGLFALQGESPNGSFLLLLIFFSGLSYNLKDSFVRRAACRQLQIKIEGQTLRFEIQNLNPQSYQPEGEALLYQMEYSQIVRFQLTWDGRLKMWLKDYSGNVLPPLFLLRHEWEWIRRQSLAYLDLPQSV